MFSSKSILKHFSEKSFSERAYWKAFSETFLKFRIYFSFDQKVFFSLLVRFFHLRSFLMLDLSVVLCLSFNTQFSFSRPSKIASLSVPTTSRSKAVLSLNTKLGCPCVKSSSAADVLYSWGFRYFYSSRAWACWIRRRVKHVQRWRTRRRCFVSATFRICPSRPSTMTMKTTTYSRWSSVALYCCYCYRWWSLKVCGYFAVDTTDTVSAVVLHPIRLRMMPRLKVQVVIDCQWLIIYLTFNPAAVFGAI